MFSLFFSCKHRHPHISAPGPVPGPSHWTLTTAPHPLPAVVLRRARSDLGEPCQASPPPPGCGLLPNRKQGPSPAPFRRGV